MKFFQFALCSLLLAAPAHADIAPPQQRISVPTPPHKPTPPKAQPKPTPAPAPATTDNPRDPVSVAKKTPAIAERIAKLKGGATGLQNDQAAQLDERITVVELDGQCGFAGCSSTTLVVFTYRTRGANTATSSVMAMVSCPPIMRQGCTAVPAEVRPQGQLEQAR